MAALMTVFLLSLGGFPPTAGFVAKWYIFSAAVRANYYDLAIVGMLTSVNEAGPAMNTTASMPPLSGRPTTGDRCQSASASAPNSAFSLGFFNLASQPALNAEMVLHLMLRMIQRLRVLIQALVSSCDSGVRDRTSSIAASTSLSSPDTIVVVDGSSPPAAKAGQPSVLSIAGTSHAVAELVSEKEKLLVERLSGLTGVM